MSYGSEWIVENAWKLDLLIDEIETKAREGIWETKDGRKMRIKDMSTRHIENTIAMLKRNDSFDIYLPLIGIMEKELERRE